MVSLKQVIIVPPVRERKRVQQPNVIREFFLNSNYDNFI